MRFRIEKDPLGKKKVPNEALYGIHTQRAKENFPISNVTLPKEFFHTIAELKIAYSKANAELGLLDQRKASYIIKASKEILQNKHDKHFIIDQFQAGMGTPTHMNVNEVIANRALVLMGYNKGRYHIIHPNDHVNMGQSTNNVVPSALKMLSRSRLTTLLQVLDALAYELSKKAKSFNTILKSGRTHLQDAVPISLGQEFHAYATAIKQHKKHLEANLPFLTELNLGGNAIGTGVNTTPDFAKRTLKHLKSASKIPWRLVKDPIFATQFHSGFIELSGDMNALAVDLVKIGNDLRLLTSGPRAGLHEINLPAVEPGSSIMPGKVNPSMPEMLTMVCFQVMGNDEAMQMAAQAGQLELNVMFPLIAKNTLENLALLTNAIEAFTKRCLTGITANKDVCAFYLEHSSGIATFLNPYIGYDKAAAVVEESLRTGLSIPEVVLKRKLLTKQQLKQILNVKRLTKPSLRK